MDQTDIAKFMRLTGAISGGRTDRSWLLQPFRRFLFGRAGHSQGRTDAPRFARLQLRTRSDRS